LADKTFERMLKCLELSTSDNDAEALLAIRKANQLRAKLGLSWETLLSSTAQAGPTEAEADEPDEYDYDAIFTTIRERVTLSDKWRGILASVEDYYRTVGTLSPKQHALVMKFFKTAMEARS
jgi:hypothetical protein